MSFVKEVTRVTKRGNSLGVSITKTCKKMGLVEGDLVVVDVKRAEIVEKEDEQYES